MDFLSPCINFKKTTKGKLPIIIKTILMISIFWELKKLKEELWLEKPPVEIVVIEWVIASKPLIPNK